MCELSLCSSLAEAVCNAVSLRLVVGEVDPVRFVDMEGRELWWEWRKEEVRGGTGRVGVTDRLGDRVRVRAREAREGNVEDATTGD